MSLRECDETFYWFLTFKTEELDIAGASDVVVRKAMGLDEVEPTLNLWPCRKCGAMVHGGLRYRHRKFHEELEAMTP